ncbi:hypothetical protein QYF61_017188 [Mycteria americana]|uniref:ribonuclease H n=1 Tax=Mycteria americana TaxID=33587 RepID=A0AAN7NIU1_MYCAM|nr:hypothetical protein QYF61_017188 [Mycteria americana]
MWSKTSMDVGLLVSGQPVNIKPKGGHPLPAVKQYPSPQEAEKSIQKQIDRYLAQGILQHIETPHPVVPNPSTILLQIPHWARYFTVIDLRAAFFSIPLDEGSQLLYDLMWKGQQLTWIRLPQGFAGSPTIFSRILRNYLRYIKLPGKSALVKYAYDFLIANKDEDACIRDTIHLCTALVEKGHSASPSKLQLSQKKVKYLGFILREGHFRFITKKQLQGFLGAVGFCRPRIPGSLTEATRNEETEPTAWGPEREQAFKTIKGLPDYTKPFNVHVHEQKGIASGVIRQKLGPHHRPDAYYSIQLDPVVAGAPACVKSAAAAAILEKSHPLILGHPVTVYVPHKVEMLLKQYETQALSPQSAHRYELILLMADNVTLQRCNTLNPAMLLPLPDEGEEHHQCERVMLTSSKSRTDLTDVPLQDPDLALFVDGSSYYLHGQQRTGYAMVSQGQEIEADPLPARLSAQGAELVVLTHRAHLGKGKRVSNLHRLSVCLRGMPCNRNVTERTRIFHIIRKKGIQWRGNTQFAGIGPTTQRNCCDTLPSPYQRYYRN